MTESLALPLVVIGLAWVAAVAGESAAQTYPIRPIRVVVPFAAGGGSDLLGRLVAQKLTEELKQQAYVDNRAGAGGRIGTEFVAKSAPDGYTLLVAGSSSLIIGPALYSKLPYNVQTDLAPVTMLASSTYLLVVHPAVPIRTTRQLIDLSKAKPGALNYASSGVGTPGHLSGELFQAMAKVKMTHIAYKGSSLGLMSVVAGESDLMFSNIIPAMPPVQSGRLRAIAITSAKRASMLPEIPTIAESGLPGYETVTHYSAMVAAGTPGEVITRLNAVIAKGFQTEDTRRRLQADGSEVMTSTPDELATVLRNETAKWTKVIKAARIAPD
jgi:tripartite-type tricarboxylate transporter receptor subunit TctC